MIGKTDESTGLINQDARLIENSKGLMAETDDAEYIPNQIKKRDKERGRAANPETVYCTQ
ncbi:hypothetical protein K0U27_00200 [archaeon]|nr:hypothetical protein [archaeon]